MGYDCSPTSSMPTHHWLLTKGTDGLGNPIQLGLIFCKLNGENDPLAIQCDPHPNSGLKMYSGRQRYSDRQPPFTEIEQRNWDGGRGSLRLEDDLSAYFDGDRADSTFPGMVMLGPMESYSKGHRNLSQYQAGDGGGTGLIMTDLDGNRYRAYSFTAESSITMANIELYFMRKGSYTGTAEISVQTDSSGPTGTKIGSATITPFTDLPDTHLIYKLRIAITGAITSGTKYWIVIDQGGAYIAGTVYLIAGCSNDNACTTGDCKWSANGSSWSNTSSNKLVFRILATDTIGKAFFFKYKGGWYQIKQPDIGGNPTLWINGDQGVATAGTTTTLTDSTKTWVTDEHIGSIVVFYEGTGSTQPKAWSRITDSTGTQLTFDAVDIAPDATTVYNIVGSNKWTEITGHGLTVTVTDVLSTMDAVYFCQGDGVDMRRMRRYVSAGAWTNSFTAETGNTATFLKIYPDYKNGLVIWRGLRTGAISRAPALDCSGTGAVGALVFGTAISACDLGYLLTGLEIAGDPLKLWVFSENGLSYIDNDTVYQMNLRELSDMADGRNGVVHGVANTYLYFNILNTWHRLYSSNLDNVGPTRGAGLPASRRGNPAAHVAYAGRQFLAIDGGISNYSSILVNNGMGWHEYYRAPRPGARIQSMGIQSIPGNNADRLWFSEGGDIAWLPLPQSNPYYDDKTLTQPYKYTHQSSIEFAATYAQLDALVKYWHSLSISAEMENQSLTDCQQYIYIYYRIATSGGYTYIGTLTNLSWGTPLGGGGWGAGAYEQEIASTYDTSSVLLQVKLVIRSDMFLYTPRLYAMVIKSIVKIPVNEVYTVTFRVADRDKDLLGDPDSYISMSDKITRLRGWENSPSPVYVNSLSSEENGKWMIPIPGSLRKLRRATRDDKEMVIYRMKFISL